MEPKIIYEDADVLVINKPAGLIVHSDGRNAEPSLADWLVSKHPEMKGVGEPWTSPQGEVIDRPGIVHRLDKTTSGVMIVAKHQKAFEFLKEQFQSRSVEKEYVALTYGAPKAESGVIEAEIARIKTVPARWSAQLKDSHPGNKRNAITEWRVLRRAKDPETGEEIGVIALKPKTGRTHQIRVHLQALKHSIIADHLYAMKKPQLLGMTRPALHAAKLTVTLPSGGRKTFEAPLADDMAAAEAMLR